MTLSWVTRGVVYVVTVPGLLLALRHSEQLWTASGTFWTACWATIYQLSGENDFIMYTILSHVLLFIPLALANLFYLSVDLTGRPHWMMKYKIQEYNTPVPVDKARYWKVLKCVIFNSVFIAPIYRLLTWPLARWRGVSFGYELPSFTTVILHLLFYCVAIEVALYYTHRLFHHPRLYKHIHKIHHENNDTFGLAASYCHPLEHIVVNLFPLTIGPILIGSHMATEMLWIAILIFVTTNNHSGYHLPFLLSPEAHDYHHAKLAREMRRVMLHTLTMMMNVLYCRFNENYGAFGIFDRLHNTDVCFRKSKQSKRNVILFGLSSAKELIPDTTKTKVSQ